MKQYLKKLAEEYEKAEDVIYQNQKLLDRIEGKLTPGSKCFWCYEEDVAFWKEFCDGMRPVSDWPYSGFIIPFPETNGRNEVEAENVCVVMTDYPIEKENPVTDWLTLAQILQTPILHKFVVVQTPLRVVKG